MLQVWVASLRSSTGRFGSQDVSKVQDVQHRQHTRHQEGCLNTDAVTTDLVTHNR